MEPDQYQQAWKTYSSQTRVTIDADLLRSEVRRHQRNFRSTIFWRDFREVGVALLMVPIWIYMGIRQSLPWSWYLTVPALLWVAGFMLVDRRRHPQQASQPSEPVIQCVKVSLAQMEHQIWLLRNVFWWYLLPPSVSIMAFFTHSTWLRKQEWSEFLGYLSFLTIGLVVVYGVIYLVNQLAVRRDLEPRRQELQTLLTSLGDETNAANAASHSIEPASVSPFAETHRTTPRRTALRVAVAALVVLALVPIAALVALWRADRFTVSNYDQAAQSEGPLGESLAGIVTDQRQAKRLVGLAAMVMVDGEIQAAAAHGERKIGSNVPVEISDRWHLGGITKSITATMIARLIESEQLLWSSTVADIFPDSAIHEDWKPVTIQQLLTDSAGAPANFPIDIRWQTPSAGPDRTQARLKAVVNVMADQPIHPPGQNYVYSNVGYTILGAMAEKVTGMTWENLVRREVFEPLELTSAGFGPPESRDETLAQPRGHRMRLGGKTAVDDDADNTPIMGPSGTIHMTLGDLCAYGREHMRGELGEGTLLSAESYQRLHTPELSGYGCGWIKAEPGEKATNMAYWHNGSNTFWYAMIVFIPEERMVVAVSANDGDFAKAEAAAWEIVTASELQVRRRDVAFEPQAANGTMSPSHSRLFNGAPIFTSPQRKRVDTCNPCAQQRYLRTAEISLARAAGL